MVKKNDFLPLLMKNDHVKDQQKLQQDKNEDQWQNPLIFL